MRSDLIFFACSTTLMWIFRRRARRQREARSRPRPVREGCFSAETALKLSMVFPELFAARTRSLLGTFRVTTTGIRRLTSKSYGRNVFHVDFKVPHGVSYRSGDALYLYAPPDRSLCRRIMRKMNFDGKTVVRRLLPGGEQELTSVEALLTTRDLHGPPTKKLYAKLASKALSRYERLKLQHLATDDREFFKVLKTERTGVGELLLQHQSVMLDPEDIWDLPRVKPRAYSIASSSHVSPDVIGLLVLEVEETTPLGKRWRGAASSYLSSCRYKDGCLADIKPSGLKLPPTDVPLVLVGLGTGLAPFRGFLQERRALEFTEPVYLYFGARQRKEEFFYQEELSEYLRDGTLTKLGLAFSRDQADKVYVQDIMKKDLLEVQDALTTGHFFLCGPPDPLEEVNNVLNLALGEGAAGRLRKDGRYHVEVY